MRKLNIFLVLLLSALLAVSAYMIWKEMYIQQKEKKVFDELLEIIEPIKTDKREDEPSENSSETGTEAGSTKIEQEVRERNLAPLFERNKECIGWICIE